MKEDVMNSALEQMKYKAMKKKKKKNWMKNSDKNY
jgi:hypothetical protein